MQMPNLTPAPGSLVDRIMTVLLANLMWFVFAVLIVTLPAATAGLFAVLAPLVRGRDAEFFATFFGTMRRQWLKSTVIVAADVLLGGLIAINLSVLNVMNPPGPVFWMLRSTYIFLGIAALLANLYAWPLLVLFDLRLRRLVTVSLKLAFTHMRWSLFTLGLALLPLSLALIVPLVFSVIVFSSTVVLIVNWGAWRVIEKYATPEEFAALDRPWENGAGGIES
jgi:uncharacterized membrane protein YesL